MKTPIFEKSVWKWIFAWLATCWVFFLGVFAADFASFNELLIDKSPYLLTLDKWNSLIWGVQGFVSAVNANNQNYAIPAWAVMIFNWNSCPGWWERWVWGGEYLIMPSKEWTALGVFWEKDFTITAENLPKHSHYIVSKGWWNDGVNEANSLSEKNFWGINNVYSDYTLDWSNDEPTLLKTSDVWEEHPKPITFMPKHQKVLFCVKKSN